MTVAYNRDPEPLIDPKPAIKEMNALRIYTKLLVAAVLFLIFAGAMVTSNDAGLAVPDWPTTYGENMFLYPIEYWVGDIFYEHTHRLIAAGVGALTLVLAIWITLVEPRKWVRVLSYSALGAVILQGVLGGLTVLLLLPTAISVSHALLAQTFLLITIAIAYAQSQELSDREATLPLHHDRRSFKLALLCLGLLYCQLFLGALMRHSGSGLAILDFPTTGGSWMPVITANTLQNVNALRLETGLLPVSLAQAWAHLAHRVFGIVTTVGLVFAAVRVCSSPLVSSKSKRLALVVAILVLVQLCLGIVALLTLREPILTSLHVVTGALLLAVTGLWCLRLAPTRIFHS